MKRVWFPLVMGVVGCAVLLWLGFWQVDRLGQKETLLAQIEARIGAEPVAVPKDLEAERDRFLPVAVKGYLDGRALFVLAPGETGQGPGFRVIAPLAMVGRTVMVDLGFVPEAERGRVFEGQAAVVGNLHWPREVDGWTPAPDDGTWFARDVVPMAEALGTEPVLVVARSVTPDLGTTPRPVSTAGIPNDHFGYAVTWFGLALVWAVMSIVLILRTLRAD